MNELSKINRIIQKEYSEAYLETLIVLDGTTGQNAMAQAKQFKEANRHFRNYFDEIRWNSKRRNRDRNPVRTWNSVNTLVLGNRLMIFRDLIQICLSMHYSKKEKKIKMLELKDFEAAYNKVQEVVLPTKLIKSDYFSDQTGNDVYLKPENMQLTGAYKIRGAYYKISTLSEEEKAKGLITASAGNHAQGVALAAARQGVKATIVMPTTTPLLKVNRTKILEQK